VTDVLPAGLSGVSAPGCDLSALPLVTCTLSLAPGVTEIVITANAPITSGVITNTAGIISTVPDPDALDNSASVTVTVMRQPIAGLTAINDSPTVIGHPTVFTATVTAGSDIVYEWDFGDGSTGSGDSVSHVYGTTGDYTAVVTASNSVNNMTATTQVSVVPQPIYLPLVMCNYAVAPDLVVDSIVASGSAVTVTIRNQGDAPVADVLDNEFWVDVYIDPDTPPTRVNQTWKMLGDQGLVWGVKQSALPLEPDEVLVLTMDDAAYYRPDKSVITGTLLSTTPIWAQVDSAHAETDYGAVLENHEMIGGDYNNIKGPVYPSVRREK
jgi:PKD repeat protein